MNQKERPAKVLVVEGDGQFGAFLRHVLESFGYVAIVTLSGREALEQVCIQLPDVITLDLLLLDIEGVEVCRQLKRNAQTKYIPIGVATGYLTSESKSQCFGMGIEHYLVKPFSPSECLKMVSSLLHKV